VLRAVRENEKATFVREGEGKGKEAKKLTLCPYSVCATFQWIDSMGRSKGFMTGSCCTHAKI